MCATKPSASWPHSPSRISSRACALLGIRSSPRQGLSPVISSGVVRVVGDRDGTGVRHRHRHRAHPHDQGDLEPLDDLAHRSGEGLPAVVGLRPVQQQVRRAAAVAQQPHDEAGRVVVVVVVAGEGHRRATGAVVVELVDVEGRHHRRPRRCRPRSGDGGEGGGAAGVEEPVERPGPWSARPARRAPGRRRRCARAGSEVIRSTTIASRRSGAVAGVVPGVSRRSARRLGVVGVEHQQPCRACGRAGGR